ncbi:MAG: hypothetical protein U5R31_10505 [Acidimicrobiia bacterium]|nr:hypothetical protein [Acidimicrobiia bacterium]
MVDRYVVYLAPALFGATTPDRCSRAPEPPRSTTCGAVAWSGFGPSVTTSASISSRTRP